MKIYRDGEMVSFFVKKLDLYYKWGEFTERMYIFFYVENSIIIY